MAKVKLSKYEKELLIDIVGAGENGTHAEKDEIETLVEEGFVEMNEKIQNEEGEVAVRCTQKGVDFVTPEATKAPKEKEVFEIETGIPIPEAKRAQRPNKYPFDALGVGCSFHMTKTEERPKPENTLQSSVSGANKRNKDEGGNSLKTFVVRVVDESDPKGPGARVFRTL